MSSNKSGKELNAREVLESLNNSLELLGTTIDRHLEAKKAQDQAAAEVQKMGADRTRLGLALDDAEARCQRLENVNREVSAKLVNAMETIRVVLEKNGTQV